MIQYGLISRTDANTLERTIDLICQEFPLDYHLKITEIGLFNCETSNGIMDYVVSKGKCIDFIGIDNEKDKPITTKYISETYKEFSVIIGNSTEVYNALPDNSQHLIFQDGCHSFPCVIADFFCYAPKVKVGGYMAWHDTGKHIKQFKDWQRMGSEGDSDMYISVRKALKAIGLFEDCILPIHERVKIDVDALVDKMSYEDIVKMWQTTGSIWYRGVDKQSKKWELIFDEADPTDEAGGVTVFKKLF